MSVGVFGDTWVPRADCREADQGGCKEQDIDRLAETQDCAGEDTGSPLSLTVTSGNISVYSSHSAHGKVLEKQEKKASLMGVSGQPNSGHVGGRKLKLSFRGNPLFHVSGDSLC